MDKKYDPKLVEGVIYENWEKSGFFAPEAHQPRADNPNADKYFSIILPPPNVTGILHMGHAIMLVIQDILIRHKRMQGFKTLWIPGTDHAAIATQERVEKELYKKEKKTRHDLGREKFLKKVEEFAKASHDTIVDQIKKMGASLDWSREAFTLDEKRSLAVKAAFKKMYDAGLIYRGSRIVNWDSRMQTTVSDDEVEWLQEKAPFYYLKYGPFIIGTARPETKFGDKYVVMHPQDKRYKKYKEGDKLDFEWINGKITATVIKDKAVDPEFGTGVMTITPSHDATDFDIAERHKLDKEQIIDFNGKLLPIAQEFAGEHITRARGKIVEKLKAKGLVEKIDSGYIHRIAKNKRGGGTIEPQIMKQWFVNVSKKFKATSGKLKGIKKGDEVSLKEVMEKAVKSGQIKIIPEKFEKIYFHWIHNLRDWCISRQLWYGHRIPVWYRDKPKAEKREPKTQSKNEKTIYVDIEPPNGGGWKQDSDTLDTWFSSGLWTFSTLGWPFVCAQNQNSPPKADLSQGRMGLESTLLAEKIKNQEYCKPVLGSDLEQYHPTSVLETGYDILFFWVARMVLMSGFLLGEIPFKTVYLHGLVRDEKGRKMSKSLGNIVDPLGLIEKYGSDAVRMSLIIGNAPGSDLKLKEDKIRGYRNFATKIWNIARFIEMQEQQTANSKQQTAITFSGTDKVNLEEFEKIKKQTSGYIENFELHRAGEIIYHYIWHTFADKIIEEAKSRLKGSEKEKQAALSLLETIFLGCLKLLHPFMPFITEEIYQNLYRSQTGKKFIMIEEW